MKKYIKQEVELLRGLLEGDFSIEEVYENLVFDPELRKICADLTSGSVAYSEDELEDIDSKLILHFASNLQKEDLVSISGVNSGNKEELIDAIIHHPEFYDDGLDSIMIETIVLQSTSIPFLEKTLNDSTLPFDSISKSIIQNAIMNLKIKNAQKEKVTNSDIIASVLNGYSGREELLTLISDLDLYFEVEAMFNGKTKFSQEQQTDIYKRFYAHLATKFDVEGSLWKLENADPSEDKTGLINALMHDKSTNLEEDKVIRLVTSTNSISFMQEILKDETIVLSQECRAIIQEELEHKIKWQKGKDGEMMISILSGKDSPDELLKYITDPELKDKYEQQLLQYDGIAIDFSEELLAHLVSKLDSENLWDVENMPNGKIKNDLINFMIHNPEYYEGRMDAEEIVYLVSSTESLEFMNKSLEDATLNLPDANKLQLQKNIDALIIKQKEKEKEKTSRIVVKVLRGELNPKEALKVITDETIKAKYEEILQNSPNFVGEDATTIDQDILIHFASHITSKHFRHVRNLDEGPNKTGIIDAIIHHPEFFNGGIKQEDYEKLIISTKSIEFINKTLVDPNINIDVFTKDEIEIALNKLKKEEEKKNRIPSVLDYTPEEAVAVKTYEGVCPGKGPLSANSEAYKTMNVMLFPGLDNEFARIYEDRQSLNDGALREPSELLELSTLLYTAMYKYGKKMKETAYTTRVDRSASFPEMEKRGEIISNFSTSLKTSYLSQFSKAHITLVQAEVLPGTACLEFGDFFEELNMHYNFSNEKEILIAPFSPITMIEEPMSEYEMSIRDNNGGPPDRKIKMVVSPPPKARPLSEEEKADKAKQLSIFQDPVRREQAAELLRKLSEYSSKEEAIKAIPREEFEKYVEWKAAYQSILKYSIREISLEIDKGLAAERGEEFIVPEPPETPELTVVPEIPWQDEPEMIVTSWEDETLELPTINEEASKVASWEDETLEMPVITDELIQQNKTQENDEIYEVPMIEQTEIQVDNIETKTSGATKLDPNLMNQLATTAKMKPLSKINQAISSFAEKVGLKFKEKFDKLKPKDEERF